MRENKKCLAVGCISGIVLAILIYFACRNAMMTLSSGIVTSKKLYYLIMLIVGCIIFCALKSRKCFIAYIIILFSFFVWLSFADVSYSPTDETMNFEYINHIIEFLELPTFDDAVDYSYLNAANNGFNEIPETAINYEAVQAPLYYIVMAVIGGAITNAYIRFHVLRVISLLSALIVFGLVNRTISYMQSKGLIQIDFFVYRMALVLTIFNPGYLYRASRLNNEMLVCILMAALLYFSVRCIAEGYCKKYYWILSFICVSLFLTKNTAIYVYALFGMIVLYQKKIKEAIIPVVVGGVCTFPWFAFNYNRYGSLTAMGKHLEYVLPIANPEGKGVDLFDAFFNILPYTFFSGEEVAYSYGEKFWLGSFLIIVIFLVVNALVSSAAVLKKIYRHEINGMNKRDAIHFGCAMLLVFAAVCLVAGTISTKLCSVRGRYFYAPCIVIVILLLIEFEEGEERIRKYVYFILIAVAAIGVTRNLITFTDKVFKNQGLYGVGVSQIGMEDIVDKNWNHGVARGGEYLLVAQDGSNYKLLIGRHVILGDQESIIQNIRNEGEYVYLILRKKIDAKFVESNIVRLGELYESNSYNTEGDITIIENIEGQEVAQEISIKEDGLVIGFEIQLGTYNDTDYDASVNYRITDIGGNVVTDGNQYIEDVVNDKYAEIYFDRPIEVKKDSMLLLSFTIDNGENKPLAAYITQDDAYPDGKLYLDNKERVDQDIRFKLWTN